MGNPTGAASTVAAPPPDIPDDLESLDLEQLLEVAEALELRGLSGRNKPETVIQRIRALAAEPEQGSLAATAAARAAARHARKRVRNTTDPHTKE